MTIGQVANQTDKTVTEIRLRRLLLLGLSLSLYYTSLAGVLAIQCSALASGIELQGKVRVHHQLIRAFFGIFLIIML